mmetsp:Transcript_18671/g.30686  ORF Transcript_18671/g.30686 Transcript_18671/m.30686 type:complete len:399 (+) Transcript_18671:212-1408(+)|eukprot:CAMPEP_0184662698 /NCGR_PEP_ID=MMETSP0308-20130426/44536_1 /TAXON_ID=38269 /ORGANISM="Gloeochaete witrockiana, Strain SAG 46.84" /LENGTH=398 /DNA_ID=CAMNT_0027104901 /DNA_START=170 /DNA_END=1366 /DNA_ORIENTATION=+
MGAAASACFGAPRFLPVDYSYFGLKDTRAKLAPALYVDSLHDVFRLVKIQTHERFRIVEKATGEGLLTRLRILRSEIGNNRVSVDILVKRLRQSFQEAGSIPNFEHCITIFTCVAKLCHKSRSGVSLREFALTLFPFCRESFEDRLTFALEEYDEDNDGFLSRTEFHDMFHMMFEGAARLIIDVLSHPYQYGLTGIAGAHVNFASLGAILNVTSLNRMTNDAFRRRKSIGSPSSSRKNSVDVGQTVTGHASRKNSVDVGQTVTGHPSRKNSVDVGQAETSGYPSNSVAPIDDRKITVDSSLGRKNSATSVVAERGRSNSLVRSVMDDVVQAASSLRDIPVSVLLPQRRKMAVLPVVDQTSPLATGVSDLTDQLSFDQVRDWVQKGAYRSQFRSIAALI